VNELLVKQCNQLILELMAINFNMYKTYLNGLETIDIHFLSMTCHSYGIKFNTISCYFYQLEIAKLSQDTEGIKTLISIVRKELSPENRN